MSFQLVGQVVGSYFGPIGSFVGSVIGGAIDRANAPDGPGPGDLSAPGIALGTRLPRVYGTVRVPVHPISISDFRATESGGGGKGGPSGPTSYSYSLDTLGAIADGSNVVAVTRIWSNKKLVYTAHGASDPDSVLASSATDYWSGFLLKTGGSTQDPAPAYEDRVTTANALAYRGMCTIEFTDLQCGSTKAPPALEVEVITNGTSNPIPSPPLVVGSATGSGSDPTLPAAAVGDIIIMVVSYLGTLTMDTSAFTLIDSATTPSVGSKLAIIGRVADGTPADLETSFTVVGDPMTGGPSWSAIIVRTFDADPYFPTTSTVHTFSRDGDGGLLSPSGLTHGSGSYQIAVAAAWRDNLPGSLYSIDGVPEGYTEFGAATWTWLHPFGGGTTAEAQVRVGYKIVTGLTENAGGFPGTLDAAGGAMLMLVNAVSDKVQWTPQPVFLSDIILAELALDPTFDPADVDVTDVAAVEVTGYVAAGPASDTIRELCDIFYVDVVPATPIKFVRRGAAVVDTVPYADTGAAVGGPGDPFAGLTRENADETPAVAAIRFPLIERDHEAGYERGDRLSAETDDVRRIETRVVMTAAQAKGRAITATLLDRVRRHKARFALSDQYAALEPGDCVDATDNDGNSARLNARRMAYADGVRSIDWELDDTTALVQTGLTSSEYTPSYTVQAAADVTLYLLDIPILRDADNAYGLYACCTATGDWQGASIYKSADDVTFTQVGDIANRATVGVTSGSLADFTGWTWDTTSTFTVTLDAGSGGTLSSATKAAVEADATLNVALVGAHGRWEVIRFTTATLVTGTTYLLSGGMLRGQLGTEAQNATHQAGDTFILLQESGMLRIAGALGDLGVARYYKAVPPGRSVASVTSQSLTTAEVGLTPYAPVDLRIEGSDLVWNRRTRLESRFLLGVDPPLGEASESYDAEIYNGGTLLDSATVSTATFVSADVAVGRIARVYQRSASIGRGQEAETIL